MSCVQLIKRFPKMQYCFTVVIAIAEVGFRTAENEPSKKWTRILLPNRDECSASRGGYGVVPTGASLSPSKQAKISRDAELLKIFAEWTVYAVFFLCERVLRQSARLGAAGYAALGNSTP